MDTDALFEQVLQLYENGDEQALRAFLVAHVNEFPEEVRNQIVFFFFEEAVTDHAEGLEESRALLEEGADTLETLGALKKELEDRLGAEEVRARLAKHRSNS